MRRLLSKVSLISVSVGCCVTILCLAFLPKNKFCDFRRSERRDVDKGNNVQLYIQRKLANMSGEARIKEEKHLTEYVAKRNAIIELLPNITKSDVDTTFHVLVDATVKVPKYDIIILVTSYTLNFDRRKMSRKTWANTNQSLNKNWKAFFMTAGVEDKNKMIDLYNEAMREKDVLIQDFIENYSITCVQKIMTGLQWATANFEYDYIMKVDDDVFVDVDAVLTAARKVKKKDLYMGRCKPTGDVLRSGKHAVPIEEFPRTKYDPYCSGGGIVFSRSLVEKMIPIFKWEHPLRVEDAYYGERIAKLGVNYTHNNHFYMGNYGCGWYDDLLMSHSTSTVKGCMEKLQRLTYMKKIKYL